LVQGFKNLNKAIKLCYWTNG